MNYISSLQNPIYKWVKSLNTKKYRHKEHKYIIEGYKYVQTAIQAGQKCHMLIVSSSYNEALNLNIPCESKYVFSEELFSQLLLTEHSQGVIGVLEMPDPFDLFSTDSSLLDKRRILLLDRIQDPGNLGTIIRTVDATGYSLLVMNKGCVDMFNEKVVRSSAGSISNIQYSIVDDLSDVILLLKKSSFNILVTALTNAVDYLNSTLYTDRCAIVIGNEANGVSSDIIELGDHSVKIPIYGNAESLNAAVATGILLYKSVENLGK